MKYERFEQLPVWKTGVDLARGVYALTAKPSFRRQRSLRDQLERAAVSGSNNVAEGFKRGTTQELLTFLYIARGSAGEVRSMLCLLALSEFADLKSEISDISDLKSQAESISRPIARLGGVAAKLQNHRPAVFDGEDSPSGKRAEGPRRIHEGTGTPPRRGAKGVPMTERIVDISIDRRTPCPL